MNTQKLTLVSLLSLAVLFLAPIALNAQVSSQEMGMSQGSHEGMVLELPGAEVKMVEKLWTSFTKDNFKAKTKKERKSKEFQSLNIAIPGVSAGDKVDMYAKVVERGNGSEMMVWIGSNDGWINPKELPERYVEAEKMLMRFALDVSREQINLQIAAEEKALNELEKELDRLRKDKDRYEKNIEKAKQAIAENEAAITENELAQQDKEAEIEAQRVVVDETRKKGDF
ncbi:MAG: hypothetical protein AAFU67_09890 [Bacteroidota bacterium]